MRNLKRKIGCVVLSLLAAMAVSARAQTFKVIHSFTGDKDGDHPYGVLIRDSAGNLYGTTNFSTAFMLNKAGKVLGDFTLRPGTGSNLFAGLLMDSNANFLGTAFYGGGTQCVGSKNGCGTVYKINRKKGETVVHRFTGHPNDGAFPEAALIEDPAGNFYGTTPSGGAFYLGTIFKIDSNNNETVLYSFCPDQGACMGGQNPFPGVIRDTAGSLYGVAMGGGAFNAGVVYQLTPGGSENVLYNFTGGSDGASPQSALMMDSEGNLYGTTTGGGSGGYGVVFELSPQAGGSWNETVLYTFCSLANCVDGSQPMAGPLVQDSVGNLYGTTYVGGNGSGCGTGGCGTVFKLDTAGNEMVLHSFNWSDGANPWAGLTMDAAGNLYGTTTSGGPDSSCNCGVVFEITP
jgi:uncharacterized repeat protein (TIGR03803 family)